VSLSAGSIDHDGDDDDVRRLYRTRSPPRRLYYGESLLHYGDACPIRERR
jgi:hypothetical protein